MLYYWGGEDPTGKEYDILDDLLNDLVGELSHACTSELLNNPVRWRSARDSVRHDSRLAVHHMSITIHGGVVKYNEWLATEAKLVGDARTPPRRFRVSYDCSDFSSRTAMAKAGK